MFFKTFLLGSRSRFLFREMMAGIAVFFAMSYILTVNPILLSTTGLAKENIFVGTALASFIGNILAALVLRRPLCFSMGMGENIFFISMATGLGLSLPFAFTVVLVEGLLLFFICFLRIDSFIQCAIPNGLRQSFLCGFGLMIALLGVKQGGIVVPSQTGDFFQTVPFFSYPVLMISLGLLIIGIGRSFNISGVFFLSIIVLSVVDFWIKTDHQVPNVEIVAWPKTKEPLWFTGWDIRYLWDPKLYLYVFTLLIIHFIDITGTVFTLFNRHYVQKKGVGDDLLRKSIQITALISIFSCFSKTSPANPFIESSLATKENAKTGMVPFVVACCFLFSLFFQNVFFLIPVCAIAPCLIFTGSLIFFDGLSGLTEADSIEKIACFMMIMIIGVTTNILFGFTFGLSIYIFLKIGAGAYHKIRGASIVLFLILFLLMFVMVITGQ